MNPTVLQIFELVLLSVGVLLWIVALARARALEWFTAPSRLPPWMPLFSEFIVFVLAVCVGSLFAVQGAILLFKIDVSAEPVPVRTALITSYAMQVAWLGVAVGFRWMGLLRMQPGDVRLAPAFIAGISAFLLAVPALALVQKLWEWLLRSLQVPAPPQTAIEFIRQADSLGELMPWVVLVVVLVPIAEEFLFRLALYRFLAARMPDAVAMVISAALFGLLHGNALSIFPLTIFGVALCLAYRYTGRLITPIVMHALFNLNTLLLVKLGA